MDFKIEAVMLGVSDVDRAKQFYQSLGWRPGLDPQRRSYLSYADFSDPDGNQWILQEVTQRAPGR